MPIEGGRWRRGGTWKAFTDWRIWQIINFVESDVEVTKIDDFVEKEKNPFKNPIRAAVYDMFSSKPKK